MTDLLVAVDARPNFMKAAPLIAAAEQEGLRSALVHTDRDLSQRFFDELGLPEPTVRPGVRTPPPLWDGHTGERIAAALRTVISGEVERARTDR